MGRALFLLTCLLVFPLYLFLHQAAWSSRGEVRRTTEAGYVIPSQFSRILAVGYKGLLSDFLFLKTTTFCGERLMHQQELSEEDIGYFVASIDVITDLDPFFFDPYLLAEGVLTWETGRFNEANQLLEKGRRYRSFDWRIPYFIGFNYFYFLKDNSKGADYIMEAARLPGSPDFLPTLASRLAYYAEKTETGVLFLRGVLAQTRNPSLRQSLEKRLTALERASLLEGLVGKFREAHGRLPHRLAELIEAGYLDNLPEDPYGGRWVMHQTTGRVFSTSRFAEPRPEQPAEESPTPVQPGQLSDKNGN